MKEEEAGRLAENDDGDDENDGGDGDDDGDDANDEDCDKDEEDDNEEEEARRVMRTPAGWPAFSDCAAS